MDACFCSWETFKYVGTTWECVSIFSTIKVMKSKSRSSISDENLVPKLICAIHIKYTLDLENLV